MPSPSACPVQFVLTLACAAVVASTAVAQVEAPQFLWARAEWGTAPVPVLDYAFRVAALPNGHSVTIGHTRFPITFGAGEPNETSLLPPTPPLSLTNTGAYLVRHDKDGALVWAKAIHGDQTPLNVQAFADGSVLAAAAYHSPVTLGVGEASERTLPAAPNVYSNAYFARFGADGTLAFAGHLVGEAQPIGAATFADGSFAICGGMIGAVTFGDAPNQVTLEVTYETIFIAKYLPDGSLDWARAAENVPVIGGYTDSMAWSVKGLSDGSCVLAGRFGEIGVGNGVTFGAGEVNEETLYTVGAEDAFVACYAADGTFVWAEAAGSDASDRVEDLAVGSDDSILVTGAGGNQYSGGITFALGRPQQTTLPANQSCFVANYDASGTLRWARGASSATGWGVSAFPDGSWVVTGVTNPPAVFGAGEANETTLSVFEGWGFAARYLANGSLDWAAPTFLVEIPSIGNATAYTQGTAAFPDGTFVTVGQFSVGATFAAGQPNELHLDGPSFFVLDPSTEEGFIPTVSWFARYRAFAPNVAPIGPEATTAEVVVTTPGGDPTTIELDFDEVLTPGVTTVTASPSGESLPTGFQLSGEPVWFDVSTTATFDGPIELCFSWVEGQFANEANIALLHYENGQWVDTTTSLDTEANVVCGTVVSLSPFVVAEVEYVFGGIEQPVAADGSSIFRKGRVVPLKFQLFGPTGAIVTNADATRRLYHISNSVLGTVEVTVGSPGAANTGNEFRYDEPTGRYVYNLATSGLATGTYRADVLLDDGSTHSVQLSLR